MTPTTAPPKRKNDHGALWYLLVFVLAPIGLVVYGATKPDTELTPSQQRAQDEADLHPHMGEQGFGPEPC